MDSLREKMKEHARILLLILTIGIGIIFMVIGFSFLGKNTEENSIKRQVQEAAKNLTYSGTKFSLKYPSDWVIEEQSLEGGGIYIFVKPKSLSSEEYIPSISFSFDPVSAPVTERMRTYLAFDYLQSEKQIGGLSFIELQGTAPLQKVGDTVIESPMQETVYLSEKNGVYFVNYAYDGDVQNEEMEQFFQAILATLIIY